MVKRVIVVAGACILQCFIAFGFVADSPQGREPSVPILSLSEIKTGMRGVIRTVFSGNEIEEFGFEVLGVMNNLLGPKQDIILVQLRGEKPEFSGVVSGMSGSPAYIDGRLIGALSLRFGLFAKEPVAGVTPIESMLSLFQLDEQQPQRRAASGRQWELALDTGDPNRAGNERAAASSSAAGDPASLLEPIPTPLFFSGFRQAIIDRFGPLFRQHHLMPIRAGGGSAAGLEFRPAETDDFIPGAPVSAVLVAGDLGIYATGTLSYRDGDQVLAFGHPFFQIGATEMPMAKATILKTLASTLGSFKIAQLRETVGTIRQDRLTAIKGSIGVKPRMIPVRVEVQSPFRGLVPYRYEMFQHPGLTPLLLNITLFESVLGSLEQSDEMTIEYAGRIRVAGHPDVRLKDRLTSSDSSFFFPVPFQAAFQIGSYFSRLFNNSYETPRIEGLEISFRVAEERRAATVEEVQADKSEVRPGEELRVHAFLRPYRGDLLVRSFTLRVPEHVARGDLLTVTICDAATLKLQERRFATGAGSLDQLIELLNRDRASDRVYCQLSQARPGYFIRDRLFPSLPLSVLSVLDSGRGSAEALRVSESPLLVEEQEVGDVVRGVRRLTLTVR